MALENYRITEFQEKTQVDNGDYVLIDSATDGTHKYQLSRIPAQASAEVAAAVAAEEAAREAADAAEVTARNAAIAANVDDTLTISGKAADAKATGDRLTAAEDDLSNVKSDLEHVGITDTVKTTLLNCFRHVAFLDTDADYVGALETALYSGLYPRLTVTYNPGSAVIYTDDSLDTVKQYLTVKYYENAHDVGTTIPAANYTLSGMLTVGTSSLIVGYNGISQAVSIPGVVDFYNIWEWEWTQNGGNLSMVNGEAATDQTDATMYPSLVRLTYDSNRRQLATLRGMAPFYLSGETAVPTDYYPIPIPEGATACAIQMEPTGQWIYLTVHQITNLQYTPRVNRTTWTQLTDGTFSRGITGEGRRFLFVRTKATEAGTSYPDEITLFRVTFS